ncbi:MAG: fatty oxidation complex subunit alpha, partial [Bdellovibrio sp.]
MIRVEKQNEFIRIIFDLPNEKANKFNTATMLELEKILKDLKFSSAKMVFFESAKAKIYIAGADINEIRQMQKREDFDQAVK